MTELTRRKTVLGALGVGAAALAGCVGDGDDNDDQDDGAGTGDDNGDGQSDDTTAVEPDTALEHVGSDCGGPDSDVVYVSTGDGYLVEGTLPSPDPCYEPAVESAAYEDGTLSLTIDVVEAEMGEDDEEYACPQCAGEVVYEVSVTGLESEPVERVEVTHETGDTHVVEEAEFGAGRAEIVDSDITSSSDTRGEEFEGSEAEITTVVPPEDSDIGYLEIEGVIPTNTPHYAAVIEDVGISGSELRLAVDVESTLDDDEAGTQPLGIVEYTATIDVRNVETLDSAHISHPDASHGIAWDSASESGGDTVGESDDTGDESGY